MKSLESVLAEHGLTLTPDFTMGKVRDGSQWLFCFSLDLGGKIVQIAHFGDFRTGVEGTWEGYEGELTTDQTVKKNEELGKARALSLGMKVTQWEEARLETARFLKEECTDRAEPTPYLIRKGLKKLYNAKVHINSYGSHVLVVPVQDIEGVVWSYQRIYPEKLSAGDKFFQECGRKQGCFHLFGSIDPQGVIYVCEGFATGASIFEAFGCERPVVAAIDAGNLRPVGRELRNQFSAATLIFCADNDCYTKGQKGEITGRAANPYQDANTGIRESSRAAQEVGGSLRIPRFNDADCSTHPTDFNDLHALLGLSTVKDQIENPDKYGKEGEIAPILTKGKPKEEEIAQLLLTHFKDHIRRQDEDLFIYTGTHWELVETQELVKIRLMIRASAPGKLNSRDVTSALNTLRDFVPHVPKKVSMYTPTPMIANFKNGSLYVQKHSDGSYNHNFGPHNQEDYLTSCLPFDFLPDSTEKNEEFEAMLRRIWADDKDMEAKILRYGEDMGAMLTSLFPSISIYYGPPGTGKSTLLLLASRLIDEKNLCMVDPTAFEGFNMESMPGKLVNIITDLNTHKPISDELVKQITDRVKFRVRRKGLKDVYAYIPAVHLWACNDLPKSFEGSSRAMGRRVTIIETTKFQPVGLYNKEYHAWVFDQSPQGIANFATRGMLRLLGNRGHYTAPESSQQHMEDWHIESDLVGRFIREIREGLVFDEKVQVMASENLKIERKHFYKLFLDWQKEDQGKQSCIGKITFFRRVSRLGFRIMQGGSEAKGLRHFCGVGVSINQEAKRVDSK